MRHNEPLYNYANAELMSELNETFTLIKLHIYTCSDRRKPTVAELDSLMNRIMTELRKDKKPYRVFKCDIETI